jgi:uncharacterized SAM-binding protein YcdF (DUF218 family)
VPQAVAIDGSEVTSTYIEAVRLREFIVHIPTPIDSVINVSDPQHMRRARWAYQHVLGDQVDAQMAPVPFPVTPYQRRWWTHDDTKKLVKNEYLKISHYWAGIDSVGNRQEIGRPPLTETDSVAPIRSSE